jgi:hypothetical protein
MSKVELEIQKFVADLNLDAEEEAFLNDAVRIRAEQIATHLVNTPVHLAEYAIDESGVEAHCDDDIEYGD